jgi:hypothetical protein
VPVLSELICDVGLFADTIEAEPWPTVHVPVPTAGITAFNVAVETHTV